MTARCRVSGVVRDKTKFSPLMEKELLLKEIWDICWNSGKLWDPGSN